MSGVEQQPCCCDKPLHPCCTAEEVVVTCTTTDEPTCAGGGENVSTTTTTYTRYGRRCVATEEDCQSSGNVIATYYPDIDCNAEGTLPDEDWPCPGPLDGDCKKPCATSCCGECNQYPCSCSFIPCDETCEQGISCPDPAECCGPPPIKYCCCITIGPDLCTESWSCSPTLTGDCSSFGNSIGDGTEYAAGDVAGVHCALVDTCDGCTGDCQPPPGIILTCQSGGCGCCCQGGVFNPGGDSWCTEMYPSGCNPPCDQQTPCDNVSCCTSDCPAGCDGFSCQGASCTVVIDGRCGCQPGLTGQSQANFTRAVENDLTKGYVYGNNDSVQLNTLFLFGYGENFL